MAFEKFKDFEDNFTTGSMQTRPDRPNAPGLDGAAAPVVQQGVKSVGQGAGAGGTPTGTGFVSFGQRLAANQGNATRTAGQMADKVGAEAAAAEQRPKDFLAAFQGANKAKVADIQGREDFQYTDANPGAGLVKNAAKTALGTELYADLNAFNPVRYKDVANSLSKAQTSVDSLQTDEGRQAYLQRDMAGNAPYSAGMGRADAALTGAVGQGRFNELKAKYGNLGDSLKNANAASSTQYDSAVNAGVAPMQFNERLTSRPEDVAGYAAERTAAADQEKNFYAGVDAEIAKIKQNIREGKISSTVAQRSISELSATKTPENAHNAWLREQRFGASKAGGY